MNRLDNPVWSSLTSAHARFARRTANAARYPAAVAPFVAVDASASARLAENVDTNASSQLAELVGADESVLFVGPAPALSRDWRVEPTVYIAQMVCAGRLAEVDGPRAIELTAEHTPDVLDLTARVYPHYFRPRTVELGRYFGIYDGARLAAMVGERMRFDGHVELSAICTDPAYLGRGYAQRLVSMLSNDILDAGQVPFLHVSHENTRAKTLYERMGYRFRADIPLVAVTRATSGLGVAG